jgi:hypothetical protein
MTNEPVLDETYEAKLLRVKEQIRQLQIEMGMTPMTMEQRAERWQQKLATQSQMRPRRTWPVI